MILMILNKKILTILALLSILLIIPASFASQDINASESEEIASESVTSDMTNMLNEKNDVVYVNSTGSSEGSGTADNPVKTIQEGLNLVNDGGTLYLTGKFIGEGNCNITLDSTPDRITFIGIEDAAIDGNHENTFAIINTGTYTFNNIAFVNHYKTGDDEQFGGAFYSEEGKLTFNSCLFENNTVYGVNKGNGGAIDSSGELTINNCIFINNTADNSNSSGFRKNAADGGAISNLGKLYIYNSNFTGNNALRNGGAIRTEGRFTTVIKNCNFKNNIAAYHLSGGSFGGAIYSWECGMDISNTIFENNKVIGISGSGAQGGAISSDRSSSKINIQSCQFINNTADGTTTILGQCIYFGSVSVSMNYCTIDTGIYSASQSVDLNNNWWDSNNIYSLIENLPSTASIKNYAQLKVISNSKDLELGDLINITVKLCWSDDEGQENINLIPLRTLYLESNCGVLGENSGSLSNGIFKTTLQLNNTENAIITATVDDVVCYFNLTNYAQTINFNASDVEIIEGENAVIHISTEETEISFCLLDINGVTYYVEMDNGQADALIPNLNVGNYDVLVRYMRNNMSNPYNATSNIIVKANSSSDTPIIIIQNNTTEKLDTFIAISPKLSYIAADTSAGEKGGFLYATLKDADDNPLASKTLQIALNGKIYNATTDKDGKAGLQISLNKANSYTCALSFQGDSTYNASPLALSVLTVTKKSTSIKASVKSNKVSVTLKTSKNKYDGKTYLAKCKKITLKVNGKTYSGKTNAKGIVKFTVKITKKGTYTAKIKFAGDNTYKSSAKSVKIRIK